jgi:hypothetical protein
MSVCDKAMRSMQNHCYILWLVGINIYGCSIHMLYHWKDIDSIFQRNKQCIIWTSESGVMAILVETARVVGGCARMNEDSSNTPLR